MPTSRRCTNGLHTTRLSACPAVKNSSVVVVIVLTSSVFLGTTDPPSPDAFSYLRPRARCW